MKGVIATIIITMVIVVILTCHQYKARSLIFLILDNVFMFS
jgi:hypothetical protein